MDLHATAGPLRLLGVRLIFLTTMSVTLASSPLAWAKKHKAPAKPADSNYIAALAIANRFLGAWQSNDQAAAIPLLTNHAKELSTEEGIDKLFSGSATRAFEIPHGRALRPGRYSFSTVLLETDDAGNTRRRFADFVITNTGKNDWAVDKLP
jgi:hypothetical protein